MFYLAALETKTIVYAILALIGITMAAYYITRALKGKIVIELPKEGYNGGEEITGRVTLIAKKSLNLNRMFVALIGYEIIESRDHNGKRSTRRNEVYRNEVNLLEAQQVPGGLNQTFDFTMNAPGGSVSQVHEATAKLSGAMSAAAGALNMLGMTTSQRRREWKFEARADLPGVDIAKSKKVRINLI